MNLQALYDLKERLEHAAIAGTGLIGEDFRLHRAVEALGPLAKASPVFAKIYAGAKALLCAPAEERSRRLLDVLSLVDAVVYTQCITAVSGPLTPMEPGNGTYVQIPYGTLQPLLNALSGSGSGRTALIKDYWTNHPAYFRDFRVFPHVVGALKDNYAELADLIGQILTAQGEKIVPILKEGFDPTGKTEMVRRVKLIALIRGAMENDWYLAILPESKKDVRVELITALGLCQENLQVLLDLCRTEKGKAKEAAMRSLAQMEAPEATQFWETEVKKKPDSVFYLAGVKSRITADLSAIAFRALIQRILTCADKVSRSELVRVRDTINGNYSPALAEVWRFTSEHMDEIHSLVPGNAIRGYELSGAELLSQTMMETVILNQDPKVLTFAEELAEKNRKWFLSSAVAADLLRLKPEDHFEKYSPYVVPDENETQRNNRLQIMNGLGKVAWDAQKQCFTISFVMVNAENSQNIQICRPLAGFDNRWLELLTRPEIRHDGQILYSRSYTQKQELSFWLMGMIRPDDVNNRRIIGSWLYLKLKLTGKLQPYAAGLIACGWKNWKGLLAYCASHESQVMYHRYVNLLASLPITNRERAQELRELDELVKSGRVSVWNRHWPEERVQYLIAKLENNENVEIL